MPSWTVRAAFLRDSKGCCPQKYTYEGVWELQTIETDFLGNLNQKRTYWKDIGS